MKLFAAALSLVIIAGCGSSTSKDYFPLAVGNRWVMQNQLGDATTFEIVKRGAVACSADAFDLSITKQNPRTYWAPGKSANVDYWIQREADGTLHGVAQYSTNDSVGWRSVDMHQWPGESKLTNYLLGPSAKNGATIAVESQYIVSGAYDESCLTQTTWGKTTWRSAFTLRTVDTQVYRGEALCGRYSEGSETVENNAEEWCFARGVGIVQVTYLFDLETGVLDPPLVLKTVSYHVAQ